MELRAFHNRLRIMIGIDRDELERAGVIARGDHNAWGTFTRDPFRWLIRCDDATAEKLWALIERRAAPSRPSAPTTIQTAVAPGLRGSI
jgi:hypothetical protein